MNEQTIFTAALELESSQRPAFLDEVCGNRPELRQRVERLLQLNAGAGKFMEQPAAVAVVTIDQPAERLGTQIGPYKLLQQIGEGGMGVVYMAEQHDPVKRRVALKIIKPGMDTRQVIARFEAERQALSLMDHPNIAKVLDAGTTDSGSPYFVMEFVKGQPITQYCDEKHLTPRERLELLLPVCQAIQHAHQKGIIHRDIKPTNILVTEYDQQPVPKVIDFGVAKAIGQTLTEKTIFTGLGQIVGTLEYMSPEQAKVNQLDIDTRSDVYSLGVLLYELLTGSTPLDRNRLRTAAFDEVLRIIREEDPLPPSTRLANSDTIVDLAAVRQTKPRRLWRSMRGELDWIVMKCLDKDRQRRYETPGSLARDIQRHLNDEPIEARRPSSWRAFWKYARHNREHTASVTALIVGLVVCCGVFLFFWRDAVVSQRNWKLDHEYYARKHQQELAAAIDQTNKANRRADQASKSLDDWMQKQPVRDATAAREKATAGKKFGQLVRWYLSEIDRREGPLSQDTQSRLRQILPLFDRVVADKPGFETPREVRAIELSGAGRIRLLLGESQRAEADLRQAQTLWEELLKTRPAEIELHHQNGACLYDLGQIYSHSEREDDALRHYRMACEQFAFHQPLLAFFPHARLEYSRTLEAMAVLYRKRGETAQANEVTAQRAKLEILSRPSQINSPKKD